MNIDSITTLLKEAGDDIKRSMYLDTATWAKNFSGFDDLRQFNTQLSAAKTCIRDQVKLRKKYQSTSHYIDELESMIDLIESLLISTNEQQTLRNENRFTHANKIKNDKFYEVLHQFMKLADKLIVFIDDYKRRMPLDIKGMDVIKTVLMAIKEEAETVVGISKTYDMAPGTVKLDELIIKITDFIQSESGHYDFSDIQYELELLKDYYAEESWADVSRMLSNLHISLLETSNS